jgi:uroporphyrin-III C-methyltransferase
MSGAEARAGRVCLVGAGPGDPELWTVRAARRVRDADLVLYDALTDAAALRGLTSARLLCVGKRGGRPSVSQDRINRLLIRSARRGRRVVRLKGGDPFVFGRGGEEMLALAEAGIACEVVPGVTTAVAAPELAGIPVTHRGLATAFMVVVGHAPEALDDTVGTVRPGSVTVVVLMGLARRAAVAARLITYGWSGDTPAAIVCGASTADQWVWTGCLHELGGTEPPPDASGVLVVGAVVNIREVVARAAATRQEPEPGEVKHGSHE